ncbi:protein-L-isoaspartate(D-aspartate) O-methyltransferase [Nitrosopumilus sp.]|uniref:protein-L-isoaspartate(D-aspartate) O-methyltransferase n=1 Tax=Nitrosopumilus sp. TaxID=2024843 RepID=UPI003D0F1154
MIIPIDKQHQENLDNLITFLKTTKFLTNKNVECAFRNIPRHEFVLSSDVDKAYSNEPFAILNNQTISQPAVVSRMTEWLDVKKGKKILEVGTGSGWQTAVLSFLVGDRTVFSVEIHPELVEFAQNNLKKLDINNVNVILNDGGFGYPDAAPYDRIIITAACQKIPSLLFDQLNQNGLLIAPVGDSSQSLVLLKKTPQGIVEIKNESNYVFVPLLGKFGKQ